MRGPQQNERSEEEKEEAPATEAEADQMVRYVTVYVYGEEIVVLYTLCVGPIIWPALLRQLNNIPIIPTPRTKRKTRRRTYYQMIYQSRRTARDAGVASPSWSWPSGLWASANVVRDCSRDMFSHYPFLSSC